MTPRGTTAAGRVAAWCLVALAAITFALAAARYLPSPLRFDESEWVPQAHGILRHGTPMLTYAEDQRLFARPYYGYDAHYGMWHPPLFAYSLAVAIAAFGDGNVAVRLVPLAWGLLALWLAWRTARSALPEDPLLRAIPAAVAVLSPLVLEGLFYVDIDNSSLAAAVFALVAVHVHMVPSSPTRRCIVLGVLFALALWSKLTTPALMLAAIAADTWLRQGFIRALGQAVTIALIGAGLFAATYLAYCRVLDYPASFMFDATYLGKRGMYSSLPPFGPLLHSTWWNVVWVSPPLALAGAWTIVRRVRRYLRERVVEDTDVLLAFAVITFTEYTIAGALMGKYTVPAAMAIAIVVGVEGARGLADLRVTRAVPLLMVAAALAALHLVIVPPIVVRPPDAFAAAGAGLAAGAANPRSLYLLVAVAAGLLACAIWQRTFTAGATASRTILAMMLWLAAVNPIAQARVVLSSADRSPLRPFEEYGFGDAVRWLREHAAPDAVVICPKDIGLRFGGRYYAIEPYAGEWRDVLVDTLRRADVRFVVDSNTYPSLRDRRPLEEAGFAPVAAAGDFVIYGRAETSTPMGQVTPVLPRPQ